MSAPDCVFVVTDFELAYVRHGGHAVVAQRLQEAGFDVGPMLWTAYPHDYDEKEIRERWQEAFERAGIERVAWSHNPEKQRTEYRVWREDSDSTKQTSK